MRLAERMIAADDECGKCTKYHEYLDKLSYFKSVHFSYRCLLFG